MSRRLKKVSYDGKRVLVRWEVPKLKGTDEHELHCCDEPANGLRLALELLRPHVLLICELPEAYGEVGLEVRGASFSYGGEDEVMGATITALKHVGTANAPLVLNTPHLASAPYSEEGDASGPLLSRNAIEALDHLSREAFRYVEGYRAQGDLFAGQESPADREPAGVGA